MQPITDPDVIEGYLVDASNTRGHAEALFRPRSAEEVAEVLAGLRERATILTNTMNGLEGVEMPPIGGAMYAFPQVSLAST